MTILAAPRGFVNMKAREQREHNEKAHRRGIVGVTRGEIARGGA